MGPEHDVERHCDCPGELEGWSNPFGIKAAARSVAIAFGLKKGTQRLERMPDGPLLHNRMDEIGELADEGGPVPGCDPPARVQELPAVTGCDWPVENSVYRLSRNQRLAVGCRRHDPSVDLNCKGCTAGHPNT